MMSMPRLPSPEVSLRAQLYVECELMVAYALSSGKELPPMVSDALDLLDREAPEEASLTALAALHTALSRLVAPATPRGLAAIRLDGKQHSFLHRMGAVPALRFLLFAAFSFSAVFFLTSLHQEINPDNLAKDIYTSYGWELALVMIFLLSAAGIGATFSALFEVYQSVSAGNYDPELDSIYWVRIGIGLMAGLMLAQMIPFHPTDSNTPTLTRPLLALLGGYSASVVHRILDRLVIALDSIFVPKATPDPTATERDLQQRLAEEQSRQLKQFDQLLGQVSAAGGDLGDVRSKLLTLLPGGLSPTLAAKAQRLVLDAGIGLVAGGLKGAAQNVVASAVSNAGDLAAAVVKEVLPANGGVAGVIAEVAGPVATLIAGEKSGIAREMENSAAGAVAGIAGSVASLFKDSKADGQIAAVSAVDVAKALGGALLSSSPAGLVSALVTVGCTLGDAEYQRWKARVLATSYSPELLPTEVINSASAIGAMRLSSIFGRVFKSEVEAGDRLKLQDIAQRAAGPDETFRAAFGARFASEQECDAGLREFRQVLLDRRVLNDTSPLLQGGLSASAVLDATDKARSNPDAADGLGVVMQTLDQARMAKWAEPKTNAEINARMAAPAARVPEHA